MTSEELLTRLTGLGIAYVRHEHAAVWTVEESRRLRGTIAGVHTKNLFVRDRIGRLYLIVADESATIGLKALSRDIGAKGSFSFCTPTELEDHLGVTPGAVSILALANDPDRRVVAVIAQELLSAELINCHPLDNRLTISLSPDGLRRFLSWTGHSTIVRNVTTPA